MIYYLSRTGNVKYIVNKLGLPNTELTASTVVNEPYFLFTYTDGLGGVPSKVKEFLLVNYPHCKGVIVSGNSNFGVNNFCGAANKINQQYGIPIIHKIELRGFEKDYQYIRNMYNKIIEG